MGTTQPELRNTCGDYVGARAADDSAERESGDCKRNSGERGFFRRAWRTGSRGADVHCRRCGLSMRCGAFGCFLARAAGRTRTCWTHAYDQRRAVQSCWHHAEKFLVLSEADADMDSDSAAR